MNRILFLMPLLLLLIPLYLVYAEHPTGSDDHSIILDQPQTSTYTLTASTTSILTANQTELIIQASSDSLNIDIQKYSPTYAIAVGSDHFFYDGAELVSSIGEGIIKSNYTSYDELKQYLSTTSIRENPQFKAIWDQSIMVVLDAANHGYDDNSGLSYRWSIQNSDIDHSVVPPLLTEPTGDISLNAKTTDTFVISLVVRDSTTDIFSADTSIQVYNGTIYKDDYTLESTIPFDVYTPIRVALDPSWEPFEVHKSNGGVGGLTGKYIEKFESLSDARFVTVVPGNFSAALDAVKDRDADIMFWLSDIPERSNFMSFTSAFVFLDEDIFVTINDIDVTSENLADYTVAIIDGYSHKTVLDEYFPDVSYVEYASHLEAVKALASSNADVFISDFIIASYYASTLGIELVKSNDFEYENRDNMQGLTIGYRSDSPELGEFLQNTLNEISECTRAELLNDIINPQDPNRYIQKNNVCQSDSQSNDQANYAITSDNVVVPGTSEKVIKSGGGTGNTMDSRVCGAALCSESSNQRSSIIEYSPAVPSVEPICENGTELVDGFCKVVVETIVEVIVEPIVESESTVEPKVEPEHVAEPKELTCGSGTELVDGFCKVVVEPESEKSWFDNLIESISSFFTNMV